MRTAGKWKRIALSVAVFVVIVGLFLVYKGFVQRAPFDPDEIAAAETAMWRAYYSGNRNDLVTELVNLQRNQFGLTVAEASRIAWDFGNAAMKFAEATGNYEAVALPDLERAYKKIKEVTRADFDPTAAARAELAWWVARRTPGSDSPEQVGAAIGDLYAVLYGETNASFQKAGLLRAQAAHLRDQGGINADWEQVEALLQESYRELAAGI